MNFETSRAFSGQPDGFVDIDDRSFGAFALDPFFEATQCFGGTFDFDGESRGRIQHPAGERHLGGEPVDEGTEADTLHGSAQRDAKALSRGF